MTQGTAKNLRKDNTFGEQKLRKSFEYFGLDQSSNIKEVWQEWKSKVLECHPDSLRYQIWQCKQVVTTEHCLAQLKQLCGKDLKEIYNINDA